MNKYEFMTLLVIAFFALAVALAFALRDDGRSRRIYVRHDRWEPKPLEGESRVVIPLDRGRAALPPAEPTVVDAIPINRPRRKELER